MSHKLALIEKETKKSDLVKKTGSDFFKKIMNTLKVKRHLVCTWCENTKEGINYLEYNGYGYSKRVGRTNYWETQHIGRPLDDVKIYY